MAATAAMKILILNLGTVERSEYVDRPTDRLYKFGRLLRQVV